MVRSTLVSLAGQSTTVMLCFLVACEENAQALAYLSEALNCLDRRTHNREVRGVEGTWGL